MEMNFENEKIDGSFEAKVNHAVHLKEREKLMDFINQLENEHLVSTKGETNTVSILANKWLRIAAGLLLLVAAVFIVRQMQTDVSANLTSEYYKPFPNGYKPITRSQSNEVTLETRALLAYEAEDYDEALIFFNELSTSNDDILMFKSISNFELGNFEEASVGFQTIIVGDGNLAEVAIWYLGFTYLKLDDKQGAIRQFESLAENDYESSYSKKAKEILKTLR